MSHTSTALHLDLREAHVTTAACPSCAHAGMDVIYSQDDIPVHSCLLMRTQQEALNFPTRSLRMGFCRQCGFIANIAFDPSVHRYSTLYEETQGFSPCFNKFLESLAKRLIDRYDLRGKDVLEIGCGKGEFLATLCELGDNRGIGIDPSFVPQRLSPEMTRKVTFMQEFYGEQHAHLRPDVICCRHTLEHISPTREFMLTIRRSIGDRTDTLVFFELPDVHRVLREGAFWDIYYEHCSYFTLGSLRRLFVAAGFELLESYLDYGDQYIMLVARPCLRPQPHLPEHWDNDLHDLVNTARQFPQVIQNKIQHWRRQIADFTARGKRVVLWGSGSKGVAFLTTVRPGGSIEYVVDINPYRQGQFMPRTGQQIVSPGFLEDYRPDYVIVMNPIYCKEITRSLQQMRLTSTVMAV